MSAKMLAKCIGLAAKAHVNQLDKGGEPYILHPLAVMHKLRTKDYELRAIAVLHDIVEDCGYSYIELEFVGCTPRVLEGVRALTKLDEQTHDEYLQQILSNHDACLVKLADLQHNSDLRRLKGTTQKDMDRVARYTKMYEAIKERLDNEKT